MKTVRTFTNLAEAGFSDSLLASAGIRSSLAGEDSFLLGYAAGTGPIRLQVDDSDFERALLVLERGPDAAAEEADAPKAQKSPDEDTPQSRKLPVGLFVAILIGFIILAIFGPKALEARHREADATSQHSYEYDYDHDGRADHFVTYRGHRLANYSEDRNGDGAVDEWRNCNAEGLPVDGKEDNNFDGKPDAWFEFQDGAIFRSKTDLDFNGVPDAISTYRNHLLVQTDIMPNGSTVVIRRLIYREGSLSEEWVDDDRDGTFDYKFTYDAFGARSNPVPVPRDK